LVGGQDEAAVWSEAEVDKALAARVPKAGVKSASAEIAALASWKKRDVYQRALKLPDPKD